MILNKKIQRQLILKIDNTNCSLKYELTPEQYQEYGCVGFIKAKKAGKEALYYVKDIDTLTYKNTNLPANSKNYIAQ